MAVSGLQGRMVAVFCSAREVAQEYITLARSTGEALAESGVTLIYGAGRSGLMGAVCEGLALKGGRSIGVLPSFMHDAGLTNASSTEIVITRSMHDRKEWMEDHADAFIVLPGGLGTLDELITVMTTKQLQQHTKPIVLLDPTDYYLPLMQLFAHMIEHDFIHPEATPLPVNAHTPDEALSYIHDVLAQADMLEQ